MTVTRDIILQALDEITDQEAIQLVYALSEYDVGVYDSVYFYDMEDFDSIVRIHSSILEFIRTLDSDFDPYDDLFYIDNNTEEISSLSYGEAKEYIKELDSEITLSINEHIDDEDFINSLPRNFVANLNLE